MLINTKDDSGLQGERNTLRLASDLKEIGGLQVHEHTIGYFKEDINDSDSQMIVDFIAKITPKDNYPVVAFYPYVFYDAWREMAEENWITLKEKQFLRKYWFGLSKEMPWVVGYPVNHEKFQDILKFAWKNSSGETVLIIPMAPETAAVLTESFVDNADDRENGKNLVKSYPNIIIRGHDGLWITLFSTELGTTDVLEALHAVTSKEVIFSDSLDK